MYFQSPLPSWNLGDRPAPSWTRRTPQTFRPASNSAKKRKKKKVSYDLRWKGCGVSFLGLGAYGVKAVHGEDVDGRAATALGLAPNTFGGVHGVAGLRRVKHEEAAGRRKRRWRRRRGPHESDAWSLVWLQGPFGSAPRTTAANCPTPPRPAGGQLLASNQIFDRFVSFLTPERSDRLEAHIEGFGLENGMVGCVKRSKGIFGGLR